MSTEVRQAIAMALTGNPGMPLPFLLQTIETSFKVKPDDARPVLKKMVTEKAVVQRNDFYMLATEAGKS